MKMRVELHVNKMDEPLVLSSDLPINATHRAQVAHLQGELARRHGKAAKGLRIQNFIVLGDH